MATGFRAGGAASRRLAATRTANQQRRVNQRLSTQTVGDVSFASLYDLVDNDNLLQNFENYARYGFGAQGEIGNTVVYTAIDRRASVFSEAAFKWRDMKTKRIFGDQGLAKLENPWPDGVSGDLWTRLEQDASLAGNCYIRDCGDGTLERLRPDWVWIISELQLDAFGQQVRRVIGYWYNPLNETDREPCYYPVSEVAHWAPVPDPIAHFRGMSWLTPVIREIHADIQMSEFRDAYFKNAASPNVVVKYQQKIAPKRIESLRNQIQERHSGVENAFGVMVLDEGADLTIIGNSMVDASFDVLQAAGEARILMAAGVPAIVAGAREGIRNTKIGEYSESLRALADMKIRPNWRSACATLQKLVTPPPGCQLWYDTTDVSALRQGEKDMADTMVQLSAAANQFFMAGFEPASIVAALASGDVTLLVHTGLTSVQAQFGKGKADLTATEAIQTVTQADLTPAGAPQPTLNPAQGAPPAPAKKVAAKKAAPQINGTKPTKALASAAKGQ